jgi:uncharacterized membrane protein
MSAEWHLTLARTIQNANFWVALLAAVFGVVANALGLHLTSTQLASYAAIIVSLILGSSAVAKAHIQAAQALSSAAQAAPAPAKTDG